MSYNRSLLTKTPSVEGLRTSDLVPCRTDEGNEKNEEFKDLA